MTKEGKHRFVVIALVVAVTLLHYITSYKDLYYHVIYRELYFLPIILAGFWFGLRGGLATSLAITIFYGPLALWPETGRFTIENFGNLLELLLFNIAAIILGRMHDNEKRQRENLRRAENLAAMGKAVSYLAHDMKAPLVAIGGFASQLRRGTKIGDPNGKKLDIILSQTERLETMVRDMLYFARPVELRKTATDLNDLVREIIEVSEDAARSHGVTLEMEADAEIFPVQVDKDRFQQVLLNLVTNAIEASPSGEKVRVRTARHDNGVVIEVADHGPGMSAEDRQLAFSAFYSTKKEGTGLGLPIVKKIVEAHDGRLELLKNEPTGMNFRVILPAG
ncbi:MAG: HAMP domain-containing sensor histidine kinase [Deltaproteobacteria bacterium]|jgi:two-component system sensor histidine kinase HydH